ncbi:MAG: polymer-forming cytoskeletal protein [Chitinophagales bacterium]
MFGTKNTSDPATPNSLISNRINNGTVFTGTIESDSDIRVEGTVKGTLRIKSKVAVGQTGIVEGDVHCKTADIEGRIIGDLEVSEVLTLKSTAIVEGNIYTAKIVIENGAHFDGICNMGTKDKNVQNAIERPVAALEEATV